MREVLCHKQFSGHKDFLIFSVILAISFLFIVRCLQVETLSWRILVVILLIAELSLCLDDIIKLYANFKLDYSVFITVLISTVTHFSLSTNRFFIYLFKYFIKTMVNI